MDPDAVYRCNSVVEKLYGVYAVVLAGDNGDSLIIHIGDPNRMPFEEGKRYRLTVQPCE